MNSESNTIRKQAAEYAASRELPLGLEFRLHQIIRSMLSLAFMDGGSAGLDLAIKVTQKKQEQE